MVILVPGVNCGAAKDDVYYNEFIGGVQNFTLDNIARGYESDAGGHTDLFTCEDITCKFTHSFKTTTLELQCFEGQEFFKLCIRPV